MTEWEHGRKERERSRSNVLVVSLLCVSFFAPFVFASHLLFLLLGEIVLDVKVLSDLFRGLALDHFSDRLAGKVEPEFRM